MNDAEFNKRIAPLLDNMMHLTASMMIISSRFESLQKFLIHMVEKHGWMEGADPPYLEMLRAQDRVECDAALAQMADSTPKGATIMRKMLEPAFFTEKLDPRFQKAIDSFYENLPPTEEE